MLIADPLLEEAAFIAAAVREGSLSVRGVAVLAHARAGEKGSWRPEALDVLLDRAEAVDRLFARGASMPLAGVPFVASGVLDETVRGGFERAGAFRVEPAAGELRFQEAVLAVSLGAAALAAAGNVSEGELSSCGLHGLRLPGETWAILARSCRDLALAADAVAADEGTEDILCRPLTGAVGKGVAKLRVGTLAEIGGIALPDSFSASVFAARAEDSDLFDALIFAAEPPPHVDGTRVYVPARSSSGGSLGIASRSTDIAVRVGAALDAALLVQR